MIRISRTGSGHVELADGPGLKRTQSRVESQRGDGQTPRQASSSKSAQTRSVVEFAHGHRSSKISAFQSCHPLAR
jgi:hypothetical protein